jgi:hypothetical protein
MRYDRSNGKGWQLGREEEEGKAGSNSNAPGMQNSNNKSGEGQKDADEGAREEETHVAPAASLLQMFNCHIICGCRPPDRPHGNSCYDEQVETL